VTAGLLATAVVGALTVSTPAPASAVKADRTLRPGTFTVSSFNVLGASHTPPGGKRAPGTTRIRWVNRLLVRHHVDVAGFQELQTSQLRKFLSITAGTWGVYPGGWLKPQDSENSIGWRKAKFRLVQATTVNIPYFNGHPRAMPVVLLRERSSGMMTYFTNYHNAAETSQYHNQGKWRVAASRIEAALQRALARRGIPRILTGDMNERADYFCRVTALAPLKAARPTSRWRHGVCEADKPRAVDWILGSRRAVYTNYIEDRSPLVDKTTDHPVIVSDVSVDPSRLPAGWAKTPPTPVTFKSGY
jgi:hypothetical protein